MPVDPIAFAFGLLAGGLILVTGVGAGAVVVPGLIGLFGLTPAVAVGTASIFSVLTKIVAGSTHVVTGHVSWKLFNGFGRLALPATVAAALLVNTVLLRMPAQRDAVQLALQGMVVVAATIALALVLVPLSSKHIGAHGTKAFPLLSGLLVGATGVGGGVLIVPALMASSHEPIKRIIGTSVVLGLALSAGTSAVFAASGTADWRLASQMSLGALLGMPLAGRVFARTGDGAIRRLSCLLLALALAVMLVEIMEQVLADAP